MCFSLSVGTVRRSVYQGIFCFFYKSALIVLPEFLFGFFTFFSLCIQHFYAGFYLPLDICSFICVLSIGTTHLGRKLAFKRKGIWVNMRRLWPKLLTLKFGYGHYTRVVVPFYYYFRRKKYLKRHTLLLTSYYLSSLDVMQSLIRNYRPLNTHTKRGVRYARQFFIKRRGKESQYKKLKSKIF